MTLVCALELGLLAHVGGLRPGGLYLPHFTDDMVGGVALGGDAVLRCGRMWHSTMGTSTIQRPNFEHQVVPSEYGDRRPQSDLFERFWDSDVCKHHVAGRCM